MSKREKPATEVLIVTDEAQIQQCIQMRIDVFHHEQKFPLDTEIDEYDEPGRATHFLLRSVPDHRPMGTVRLVEKPIGYKLGRLCIQKDYRGMHLGEELLKNAHSWVIMQAKRAGRPAEISLHSQIYAKAFYSRYVGVGTPLATCPASFPDTAFDHPRSMLPPTSSSCLIAHVYPYSSMLQSHIGTSVLPVKDTFQKGPSLTKTVHHTNAWSGGPLTLSLEPMPTYRSNLADRVLQTSPLHPFGWPTWSPFIAHGLRAQPTWSDELGLGFWTVFID